MYNQLLNDSKRMIDGGNCTSTIYHILYVKNNMLHFPNSHYEHLIYGVSKDQRPEIDFWWAWYHSTTVSRPTSTQTYYGIYVVTNSIFTFRIIQIVSNLNK